MRRLASQRGQVSIDYVGVIVAVGILIGAFAVAAPSLSHPLICKMKTAMASMGIGEGCAVDGLNADGSPDLSKCTLSDSKKGIDANIEAFSVKLGGDLNLTQARRGDGKYTVTINGNGSGGAKGEEGAGVEIDTGKGETDAGDDGNVSAELRAGGAATWVFDSKDDADDFTSHMKDDALGALGALATGPVGLGVYAGKKITNFLGITHDWKPPAPDVVWVKGGGAITGSADGTVAGANGEINGAVGFKYDRTDPDNPTKTAFFELGGKGSVNAASILGVDASATGQLAVTYDKDNNPVSVSVTGTGSVQAGDTKKIKVPGLPDGQKLEIPGLGDTNGGRMDINATLPLKDDPAAQQALKDLVTDPSKGAAELATAFAQNGQFTAQAYRTDSSRYGANVHGGDGFAFGLGGGYESTDADLVKAWYWNPESGGLREWAACHE